MERYSVLFRIQSECGKMRENAEKCGKNAGKMRTRITPNTGDFYAVDVIRFTDHYLERKKIGTNGKQHF